MDTCLLFMWDCGEAGVGCTFSSDVPASGVEISLIRESTSVDIWDCSEAGCKFSSGVTTSSVEISLIRESTSVDICLLFIWDCGEAR